MSEQQTREVAEIIENAMLQFQQTMLQRSVLIEKAERRSRKIIYGTMVFMVILNIALFYLVYSLTWQAESLIKTGGDEFSKQIESLSDNLHSEYKQQLAGKIDEYYKLLYDNADLLNSTLKHVENITGTFSDNSEFMDSGLKDMAKTMQNIEQTTQALSPMVTELNKSLVSVEKMTGILVETASTVNKTASEAITTLVSNQKNIQKITESTAKAADNVSVEVTKIGRDVRHFTGDALPRVNTLVMELNSLSQALRNLSQEMQKNPNMLLFGKSVPAGPGER
ncbi:methyl-accepting chemotaxis protein [Candidatus Albibeggiatoa sp. nov. NOAA]|uniref:methyl-accepting chemotaxis protein n=1 Tax=Candidatus Albibeggiatoa sp. nov. NOAA TaxID=3162724 RepID=UPI00330252C1|nr:methyl-accepting chemotaxis protein [Thiotrichaceae bacterium]